MPVVMLSVPIAETAIFQSRPISNKYRFVEDLTIKIADCYRFGTL